MYIYTCIIFLTLSLSLYIYIYIPDAEAKYEIIFKTFFLVWLVQFWKKKRDKSKFSWLSLLFKDLFLKFFPNISEQKEKLQRFYDLLNAETKPKKFRKNWSFYVASIKLKRLPPWFPRYEAF